MEYGLKGKVAIVGLGETRYYKRGASPVSEFLLVCEAVKKAAADAGLDIREIDGFASYSNDRTEPTRLAAALGWPLLWRMTGPLAAVLMGWLLYQHFCLVLPRMRRGIGVAIGAMLLCWAGVTWTLNWRGHDRLDAAPYMPVLPMAGWRVGTPSKPDDLLQAMQPLRERLKARVDKAARDEPETGDSGE